MGRIVEKVLFDRVCQAPPGEGCQDRLSALAGAVGLFGQNICARAKYFKCPHRTVREIACTRRIKTMPVVSAGAPMTGDAGARYLVAAGQYDVLPWIEAAAISVAYGFAADYSRAKIPWVLVVVGPAVEEMFALYKRLSLGAGNRKAVM